MDIAFLENNVANPQLLIPKIHKDYKSKYDPKKAALLDPANHDVMDKSIRPDRVVYVDSPSGICDSDGKPVKYPKIEKVNRIALGLQALILERMVSFLTGGKVLLKGEDLDNEAKKTVYKKAKKVWNKNKLQYKNGAIAHTVFSETECAEVWYSVVNEDKTISLKCKIYRNSEGYKLHPIFDSTGDLIAFALGFDTNDDETGRKNKNFDLYTATFRYRYIDVGEGWVLQPSTGNVPNPLPLLYGKMPVVYYPGFYAWAVVQGIIERLEYLLSNFGDTNDYNGSPILAATGDVKSFAQKGESGKFIEIEVGGKLEYITWQGAPEAIKLEIETLLDFAYTLSQTPNISFKEMKGLGDISGTALERLFIDAQLKASKHQQGDFGECIQRRLNFFVSAVIATNPGENLKPASDLEITPVFTPFDVGSFAEKVLTAITANGGKPIMSHKSSIEYAGHANDADAELEEITSENEVSEALVQPVS